MGKWGPIMVVEDDKDDQDVIRSMIKDIGIQNTIIMFDNAQESYDHLKATDEQPFIILSDINMPKLNGVEFKRLIDEDPELRERSIPFVFFTTTARKSDVDEAYKKMTVQGFFEKQSNYEEQCRLLKLILEYWTYCKHPNSDVYSIASHSQNAHKS